LDDRCKFVFDFEELSVVGLPFQSEAACKSIALHPEDDSSGAKIAVQALGLGIQ
jgi:hypothetical protein